jgi:excisionase family DNA binding protein
VAKKKPQGATSPAPVQLAPRMLAAPAAAAYLGIGTFALRHLHWDGKVRGVFIGRRLLFDKNDLDKYVDALKRAA